MCTSHKVVCKCGHNSADFTMRDEVLGHEVIRGLYCPECGKGVSVDSATMLDDNGWIIEYDMEVAGFFASRMGAPSGGPTPEFIFDEGWCVWNGYCPGDLEKAYHERQEIVKLMKTDPRAYVKALTEWGAGRARDLSEQGWRKAKAAV